MVKYSHDIVDWQEEAFVVLKEPKQRVSLLFVNFLPDLVVVGKPAIPSCEFLLSLKLKKKNCIFARDIHIMVVDVY